MDRLMPRASLLLLFLILISLVACADPEPSRESSASRGSSDYTEFDVFWADFRSAVLSNDSEAVMALTHFPFQIKGDYDGDPVILLDQAAFERNIAAMLARDPGTSLDKTTQRDLIADLVSPGPDSLNFAMFGGFVFERVDGRWWFVMANMDPDSLL